MQANIDAAEVAEFLGRRYGGNVTDVAYLGSGEWSAAYGFTYGGMSLVVRFGPHREDFAKDRLASQYRSAELGVPRVREIGQVFGGWFAISERVYGNFVEELDANAIDRVLPSLLDAVRAMQRADTARHQGFGPWDATGAGGYPAWREYLLDAGTDRSSDRTHGWRRALRQDPNADAVFTAASAALRETIACCPERHELIHNDLLNRNVFVDEHRVAGIIDWGCAMYGDSLYDVALLDFWSPWFPRLRTVDILGAARDRLAESHDAARFDERIRTYEIHLGLIHIGYNAFFGRERANEMVRVCRRTMAVVDG